MPKQHFGYVIHVISGHTVDLQASINFISTTNKCGT